MTKKVGLLISVVLLFMTSGCSKTQRQVSEDSAPTVEQTVAPHDRQLPDGSRALGERTLKDGTVKTKVHEFPDGRKQFDETTLPDGSQKIGRIEFPDGSKFLDVTLSADSTEQIGRAEWKSGEKDFDLVELPDGTFNTKRKEQPNGEKEFGVSERRDGTRSIERSEYPNGIRKFDVTVLPNRTQRIGRLELENGNKVFDVTILPDGTYRSGRLEFPDGRIKLNPTLQDIFETVSLSGSATPAGLPSQDSRSNSTHNLGTIPTYGARELASLSARNPVRFGREFYHKTIRIVGRIDEIERDGSVHFWIASAENNHTSITITCGGASCPLADFNKDETIAVTGYYEGIDPNFAAPRLIIAAQHVERQ
jgi:hypothetical protein